MDSEQPPKMLETCGSDQSIRAFPFQSYPASQSQKPYDNEKDRLPASAFDDLQAALGNPNHVPQEAPFTAGVVDAMRQVPRAVVPDMSDRIVSATAVFLWGPADRPRYHYPGFQRADHLVIA
jgi:hypothetical protein